MKELMNLLKEVCPLTDFSKEKLLTDRVLDSMDIINIVGAIEGKYNISIEFELITAENFDTVEAIYRMIDRIKKA